MFATMRIKWPIQKALAARRERAFLEQTAQLRRHRLDIRPVLGWNCHLRRSYIAGNGASTPAQRFIVLSSSRPQAFR